MGYIHTSRERVSLRVHQLQVPSLSFLCSPAPSTNFSPARTWRPRSVSHLSISQSATKDVDSHGTTARSYRSTTNPLSPTTQPRIALSPLSPNLVFQRASLAGMSHDLLISLHIWRHVFHIRAANPVSLPGSSCFVVLRWLTLPYQGFSRRMRIGA